ncbi:MAG: hypothetical protein GY737_25190 [Desulfobacteraceae bacterium]|nr:hypothetical protein [Desulfobacteraceae bacterium]
MAEEFKKYRISVEGHLTDDWESYFSDSVISRRFNPGNKPVTIIMVTVTDQAELHGIISKIRDLGMVLIHLNRIETGRRDGKRG